MCVDVYCGIVNSGMHFEIKSNFYVGAHPYWM